MGCVGGAMTTSAERDAWAFWDRISLASRQLIVKMAMVPEGSEEFKMLRSELETQLSKELGVEVKV